MVLAVALRIDSGGPYTRSADIPIIADAVERRPGRSLSIVMTPELADLRTRRPTSGSWPRTTGGRTWSSARFPEHYASLLGRLSDLSYGADA